MKTKTFNIQIEVNEQDFIEYCLNLKHSGYDCTLMLLFYAVGERWHITKLAYYFKLLDIEADMRLK